MDNIVGTKHGNRQYLNNFEITPFFIFAAFTPKEYNEDVSHFIRQKLQSMGKKSSQEETNATVKEQAREALDYENLTSQQDSEATNIVIEDFFNNFLTRFNDLCNDKETRKIDSRNYSKLVWNILFNVAQEHAKLVFNAADADKKLLNNNEKARAKWSLFKKLVEEWFPLYDRSVSKENEKKQLIANTFIDIFVLSSWEDYQHETQGNTKNFIHSASKGLIQDIGEIVRETFFYSDKIKFGFFANLRHVVNEITAVNRSVDKGEPLKLENLGNALSELKRNSGKIANNLRKPLEEKVKLFCLTLLSYVIIFAPLSLLRAIGQCKQRVMLSKAEHFCETIPSKKQAHLENMNANSNSTQETHDSPYKFQVM